MAALRVGDPMDDATDVGPLATEQGRDDVDELVDRRVAQGATVLVGGELPDGPGWFYPPTVVTGVTPEMRMYAEEVFGPVAALYRVPSVDEAIALANDTAFGLGSNVWTTDLAEQERFVRDMEAGAVFVNGMTTLLPRAALRRHQELGLRPGAVGPRHPGVLQYQGYLDQLTFLEAAPITRRAV